MILEELIFDKNKILSVNQSIEDLYRSCSGFGILNEYPTDETKKTLNALDAKGNELYFTAIRKFEQLIENNYLSFRYLIFDKNKVILAQNSVENLCVNCAGAGILCNECTIHQTRRTLASLPVKDIELFKEVKKKKSSVSGGSCGTSCSTGCGTKK